MNRDNDHDDETQPDEIDPVALLRAADPAAGVEPTAGFADEVVARATAASDSITAAAPETTAPEAGDPAPVTDLGAERTRRRPRWLPIAAAAASVAIVGAAGFWLGGATSSANLASNAAPPISLQGVGEGSMGVTDAAGAPEMTMGADQKMMGGSGAADSMYQYGWGRHVFTSSGLSEEGGDAPGYAYDSGAEGTEARVAALAAELGVEGEVELRDGSWIVGPPDGTGPMLSVGLDGALSFWFNDPATNPWDCGVVPLPGETTESSEPIAPVDPVEPCEPTGTAPSEAAAIDALRSLIAASGADPDGFEYSSETWEESPTRYAQAWPVVDGQRLDQGWSLELAAEGTVNASGSLAAIVAIGDYPIVSEQEGFERLSDIRFGAQMTAMPLAAREGEALTEEWVPPTAPPATPGEGTAVSWPVDDVEIVDARLGLTTQWQPDGSVLVVPAYEFTDADGGTWSVIAVADSSLDFSAE
ncbi:hypothetical protein [Agromyces lapidis]|uniref:Uncharacterized protein n=1 Tax=Agromyces lapidis TaxID=279574 RepID=A0ABV5SNT0_9MICO|nr:hypothetical protein [Agromyces lapidis]